MADDLKRRGPEDPKKINIHQEWEIEYWARKFGVTRAQLRAAVEAVGVMVSDVRRYLGK